ncbi:hypothetical protein BDN72DRAFT_564468 [Pluteus cervinus]|uniref:Uncharacterized protein n=1 Tax=Pluteus cervinus TaxID=181527 RepID=A0ACD3BCB8_9AGAR|nr:hypothetical protein BDN72DRAFT_564468 [Pluteus cervinus]
MFSTPRLVFISLALFSSSALGRERWLERDGKAIYIYPRRFGQEQPAVLQKLRDACPGEVCGNLAGQAVTPLLAAQPECSQQDLADAIVDASRQFDNATQANMIQIAKEYRQAEKNTPPDFSTNPPALRNSVFCQKAPKNQDLDGLVQAQDPANDPNLFFDPATGGTVTKGGQPNTFPFGQSGTSASQQQVDSKSKSALTISPTFTMPVRVEDIAVTAACTNVITVTVSGVAPSLPTDAVTVTVSGGSATSTDSAIPTFTAGPSPGTPSVGEFGSCSVPQIEFGVGFDDRKETSFQPVDKVSYNHGSAQNITIITQFMCDQLTNSCGADQNAKDTCEQATQGAANAPQGTGAQADAFNAAFGITTDFASIPAVDNQGNVIPGTGTPGTSSIASAGASPTNTPGGVGEVGGAQFGSCSTPEIEFGTGFDGRKETSFQPTDPSSYPQGSTQDIGIITRFICGALTGTCGANEAAEGLCTTAQNAAAAGPVGSGAQADAFNAVFGIKTNFASVPEVDNQGRVISGTAGSTATSATASPSATTFGNTLPANNGNLQTFTEALGGVTAPVVTASGNGQFSVQGAPNPFNDVKSAVLRSCDIQNNQCADAANASGNRGTLTVVNCTAQQSRCVADAN